MISFYLTNEIASKVKYMLSFETIFAVVSNQINQSDGRLLYQIKTEQPNEVGMHNKSIVSVKSTINLSAANAMNETKKKKIYNKQTKQNKKYKE